MIPACRQRANEASSKTWTLLQNKCARLVTVLAARSRDHLVRPKGVGGLEAKHCSGVGVGSKAVKWGGGRSINRCLAASGTSPFHCNGRIWGRGCSTTKMTTMRTIQGRSVSAACPSVLLSFVASSFQNTAHTSPLVFLYLHHFLRHVSHCHRDLWYFDQFRHGLHHFCRFFKWTCQSNHAWKTKCWLLSDETTAIFVVLALVFLSAVHVQNRTYLRNEEWGWGEDIPLCVRRNFVACDSFAKQLGPFLFFQFLRFCAKCQQEGAVFCHLEETWQKSTYWLGSSSAWKRSSLLPWRHATSSQFFASSRSPSPRFCKHLYFLSSRLPSEIAALWLLPSLWLQRTPATIHIFCTRWAGFASTNKIDCFTHKHNNPWKAIPCSAIRAMHMDLRLVGICDRVRDLINFEPLVGSRGRGLVASCNHTEQRIRTVYLSIDFVPFFSQARGPFFDLSRRLIRVCVEVQQYLCTSACNLYSQVRCCFRGS